MRGQYHNFVRNYTVPRAMRRGRGLVNATHCTDVLRDNAIRKTRSFRGDKETGAAPGLVGMIGPTRCVCRNRARSSRAQTPRDFDAIDCKWFMRNYALSRGTDVNGVSRARNYAKTHPAIDTGIVAGSTLM